MGRSKPKALFDSANSLILVILFPFYTVLFAKIEICHRTSSQTNPYNQISVKDDEELRLHQGHPEDIIPAPPGGCPHSISPTQTPEPTQSPIPTKTFTVTPEPTQSPIPTKTPTVPPTLTEIPSPTSTNTQESEHPEAATNTSEPLATIITPSSTPSTVKPESQPTPTFTPILPPNPSNTATIPHIPEQDTTTPTLTTRTSPSPTHPPGNGNGVISTPLGILITAGICGFFIAIVTIIFIKFTPNRNNA
jgi:hypothetical protein